MRMFRSFIALVCGCFFAFANASDDKPPIFRFSGGDGGSPQNAVVVVGDINHSQFVKAKIQWRRSNFPDTELFDITLPCINGKPFHVVSVRLNFGEIKEIYFDASNVRDEGIIMHGKTGSTQDFLNQIAEQIEKSNLPPEKKKEMLFSLRNKDKKKTKKPGECE